MPAPYLTFQAMAAAASLIETGDTGVFIWDNAEYDVYMEPGAPPVTVFRAPMPIPIQIPRPPGLPGPGTKPPPLPLPVPLPDWLEKMIPQKQRTKAKIKGKKLLRLMHAAEAFDQAEPWMFWNTEIARDKFLEACIRNLLPPGEPKRLKGYYVLQSGEEGGHMEMVGDPILSRKFPEMKEPQEV